MRPGHGPSQMDMRANLAWELITKLARDDRRNATKELVTQAFAIVDEFYAERERRKEKGS